MKLSKYIPVLQWGAKYTKDDFNNDFLAAVIVTIMLIPQSLAYALLSGLPPEMGLYASILPIVAYAIFGTSHALAVGPVAVLSLMTAAAVGKVSANDPSIVIDAALTLALLSGTFMLALGILRLGFLGNFLSHPVISGFITASGLIIAASQLKHILGVSAHGETLLTILPSLVAQIEKLNPYSLAIGIFGGVYLVWSRMKLGALLSGLGLSKKSAQLIARAAPVLIVIITTWLAWIFELDNLGVALVGTVPQSFPPLTMPSFDFDLVQALALPALLISIIGFVESVSVAQTLAAKKRKHIDTDQELIGLGAANISCAFSGGFPVTGGFARSVVNFDAGAATPAAGAFTAIGILLASLFLTPLIEYLPKATLAVTIIIAVLSLVDFSIFRRTWEYGKADFISVLSTVAFTLTMGVEIGILIGVSLSILLHLFKTSKPHMAIVGRVPGTEHYRNILRHKVITHENVLSLRVDESLYFANARFLETRLYELLSKQQEVRHVILMCPAVNNIDISALETLESINARLKDMNVCLHLSEVKGPVMDKLKGTEFMTHLSGEVFMSQFQAVQKVLEYSPEQKD